MLDKSRHSYRSIPQSRHSQRRDSNRCRHYYRRDSQKENANEVLLSLSGFAGDFVVATAGPDLENIIAAKGAGAHTYSKEHSTSIVNIDIGGGTSNLALFSSGELLDTGCLDIGGRLIKVVR